MNRGERLLSHGDVDIPLLLMRSKAEDVNDDSAQARIRRKPLPSIPIPLGSPRAKDYAELRSIDQPEDFRHQSAQPCADNIPNGLRESWQPYTLRWPYFAILLSASLLLFIGLVTVHQYSAKHVGLGSDDGRSIIFFTWKFLPTLLAVAYTFLWTILLDDVKHIQPYARMAHARGGRAKYTVLQESGSWWSAFVDGVSQKKNEGHRSWPLILSSTSLMLSLLVISPLSSTLLLSKQVVRSAPHSFQRFNVFPQSLPDYGDQVLPRFGTIANILQDVDTSIWIKDDVFVVPVWPKDSPTPPSRVVGNVADELWQVRSVAFKSALQCTPLHLMRGGMMNNTDGKLFYSLKTANSTGNSEYYRNANVNVTWSLSLAAASGCRYDIQLPLLNPLSTHGGASWTYRDDPRFFIEADGYTFTTPKGLNVVSTNCTANEIILVTTPWSIENATTTSWSSAPNITGQLCSTNFYTAEADVVVSIASNATSVNLDHEDFLRNQRLVTNDLLATGNLQDLFLTANWSYHLKPFRDDKVYRGPSTALFARYGYELSPGFNETLLLAGANKLKQRFLGETLLAAIPGISQKSTMKVSGNRQIVQRRVVVSSVVSIILATTIALQIALTLIHLWISLFHSRSLALHSDPSRISTTAALISDNSTTLREFKGHQYSSRRHLLQQMIYTRFKVFRGNMSLVKTHSSVTSHEQGDGSFLQHCGAGHADVDHRILDSFAAPREQMSSWRSASLSLYNFFGLLSTILVVLLIILVLFHYSNRSALTGKILMYRKHVTLANLNVSTIAPYSIIPTIIAVGIGIWWGAMETNFRVLQPFISMTQRPLALRHGVDLSYRSSYSLWAAIKASRYKHWLLALTCTGVFLSQVFTVAMSALWQVESGYQRSPISMTQSLQLRTVPNLYVVARDQSAHTSGISIGSVLANLYNQGKTSWLYSALLQSNLGAPQPAWSQDGWSFLRADISLSDVSGKRIRARSEDALSPSMNPAADAPSQLLELSTLAVRAQLHCSPYQAFSNTSTWLQYVDISNHTLWNVTLNPKGAKSLYVIGQEPLQNFNTPSILLKPSQCCNAQTGVLPLNMAPQYSTNITDDNYGPSVLAYWTTNDPNLHNCPSGIKRACDNKNFTVKWIHGRAATVYRTEHPRMSGESLATLGWLDKPELTALNCMPSIETARARVAVYPSSGYVHSYDVLDTPQEDSTAWSDAFLTHVWRVPLKNSSSAANISLSSQVNVTVSYGYLFLQSLLRASNLRLTHGVNYESYTSEQYDDLYFNIKRPGVNMDFPSYAMYSLVNQDAQSLLNTTVLAAKANQTFSTFFQHFASSNVTTGDGGWVFQRKDSSLPSDLPKAEQSLLDWKKKKKRGLLSSNQVEATVLTKIELLRMSSIAAWLCIAILIWLSITTILIISLDRHHLGSLVRDVRTIADVAILLAGSEAYLQHIRGGGAGTSVSGRELKTKLGWFKDSDGNARWGIELAGDEHGIEWLDDAGADAIRTSTYSRAGDHKVYTRVTQEASTE